MLREENTPRTAAIVGDHLGDHRVTISYRYQKRMLPVRFCPFPRHVPGSEATFSGQSSSRKVLSRLVDGTSGQEGYRGGLVLLFTVRRIRDIE